MTDEAAPSPEQTTESITPPRGDADASAPPRPPHHPPPPDDAQPPHDPPPYEAPSAPYGSSTHEPPPYNPPPAGPPPWFGAGFGPSGGVRFSREELVRPHEGRYLAGVCAAIGRATNTDPVLWRVIIAVLSIGGIGILVYLVAWLAIPAEGDTASPLESVLGRGRSGMSPVSVLLLGVAAAVTFAFVVNNGMRTVLLAGAVLGGGYLLFKNNNLGRTPGSNPTAPPATPFGAPGYPPHAAPAGHPAAADPAGYPYATSTSAYPAASPSAYPAASPAGYPAASPAGYPAANPSAYPAAAYPQGYPAAAAPGWDAPAGATMAGQPGTAPPMPPPAAPYRQPFAPHGPWASASARPPRPARPPKPPRERSRLGRITFFLILVALGLVALVDLSGVSVRTSTYFAAALATIGIGLVVGAWFGRARGLIALALLTALGLGATSAEEHWGGPLRDTTWRPLDIAAVADRYETSLGNATLDLRAVDFSRQQQNITVRIGGGRLQVLLPPKVDTVAVVDLDVGRVRLFGQEWSGTDLGQREVADLGDDGPGGGQLRLTLTLDAGDVEVTR